MNSILHRIIVLLLRLIQFSLAAGLLAEAVTGFIQVDHRD